MQRMQQSTFFQILDLPLYDFRTLELVLLYVSVMF